MKDLTEVLASAFSGDLSLEEEACNFLELRPLEYQALRAHYDPKLNFTLPNELVNEIIDAAYSVFNIREQGEYVFESNTCYFSDLAAYPPDGAWTATLYVFLGHYMWLEPEGEHHGFFDSLQDAEEFGRNNYGG
jgi:hypothetical protein